MLALPARLALASATLAVAARGATWPREQRLGSFLVIGDWGWDPEIHGNHKNRTCQQSIADAMNQTLHELGDVKFLINVGDSFYPNGVANKTDPQWDSKWRKVYSEELRAVPWYSVYGNHDLHIDPGTCGNATAAQVNDNLEDRSFFYMPNASWFVELPELEAEVVGLDMNFLWADQTCRWTPCPEECHRTLKARGESAFDLFFQRTAESNASNLLVFSHYPTDYFWGYPAFLDELSSNATAGAGARHVEFFGGHRHNVDRESTTSIGAQSSWLVGGGGGWGCDGDKQGFLVGEIALDGTIDTYEVLVDPELCCTAAWWWASRQAAQP